MNDFATEARSSAGLLSSNRQSYQTLRKIWSVTLDLLYPPCCAGCNRIDTHLCPRCAVLISEHQPPIQQITPEYLTSVYATAYHEGIIRSAVLALKQDNHEALVSTLAERLVYALQQIDCPITCIVPVPLHRSRLQERGYNQSALLAAYLGLKLDYPVFSQAITRTRDTGHQVGLSGDERRINVQNAFQGDTTLLRDHAVLLIDDVLTTGATLQACAEAVLKAGAAQAFGLTATTADA